MDSMALRLLSFGRVDSSVEKIESGSRDKTAPLTIMTGGSVAAPEQPNDRPDKEAVSPCAERGGESP